MSSGDSGQTRSRPWPEPGQFNEAVQNLATTVSDPELKAGQPQLSSLGVPMPYAGNFADVYKVHCPQTGNTWAVKFFKREVRDLRERYRAISEKLAASKLPFMVDFKYLEEGVRISGTWYPILKMKWIEGQSLNRFVVSQLDRPPLLDQLSQLWVKVAAGLRQAEIAHADLQHGNVVLVPEAEGGRLFLKLIDYDGMYVPALSGQRSGEVGHPAYQHPQRAKEGYYSAEVDRFSNLAICCALRCLGVGKKPLWERFDNGDNLLFTEQDFARPGESAAFQQLWAIKDASVQALVGHLALATQRPLADIPPVEDVISGKEVRPLSPAEHQAVRSLLGGKEPGLERLVPAEVPVRASAPPTAEQFQAVAPVAGSAVQSTPAPPAARSGWSFGKAWSNLWSGTSRDKAWGIEVGQAALKALCCQRLEDGTVTPLAFDYIEHPKILSQPDADPEQLIQEAVATFLSRNAVQDTVVAVSAPSQSAIARFVKLPPVKEEKIADIVKFEAKQQIPFPLDEVVWDYQKMGSGEVVDGFAMETEIALFALKRDLAERVVKPWQAAGVPVEMLQLSSIGIYNLIAYELQRRPQPAFWAVLSMGVDATDMIVTDGTKLWPRSIPIGGNQFTRQLTKEFKLTFAKAEQLKRNVTQASDPKVIFQALRPIYNDFVTEVQRAIGYFNSIHRKATIGGLLMLGNASRLPGLGKFLSQHLSLEIMASAALQALSHAAPLQSPAFQNNLPTFGLAYGLCLQGLEQSPLRTNLAPTDRRPSLMGRLFGKK